MPAPPLAERAVLTDCAFRILTKLRQCPIDSQELGHFSPTGRRSIAAPGLITGGPNHPRANWVQRDIPGELQQMTLLIDKDCLERALNEMTKPFVLPIEPLLCRPR